MRDVELLVALERGVWDALATGDQAADAAALSDRFLGVCPTGFATADEHAGQLADGPTVAWYSIEQARALDVAEGHVILAYLARFRRPGRDDVEEMYVSSLWSLVGESWLNVFSQDTPVGGSVV